MERWKPEPTQEAGNWAAHKRKAPVPMRFIGGPTWMTLLGREQASQEHVPSECRRQYEAGSPHPGHLRLGSLAPITTRRASFARSTMGCHRDHGAECQEAWPVPRLPYAEEVAIVGSFPSWGRPCPGRIMTRPLIQWHVTCTRTTLGENRTREFRKDLQIDTASIRNTTTASLPRHMALQLHLFRVSESPRRDGMKGHACRARSTEAGWGM